MLRRRAIGSAVGGVAGAWPSSAAPTPWWPALPAMTPAATVPTVSSLELAASDANGEVNPVFGLNWGYHQLRHCTLADGTLYLAYHRTKVFGATPSQGVVEAVVRKRSPAGIWTEELAMETVDDVQLVANQALQEVYLVLARKTLTTPEMAVVTFPGAVPSPIPGDWTAYARPSSGRYWAAGIGADGMLTIKISVDGGTGTEGTDATTFRLICGFKVSGVWNWTAQRTESVGIRKGYDFMFPGVNADRLNVLGLGAWNPHREDYPLALSGGGVDYLFSGVDSYSFSAASGSAFTYQNVQAPQPQESAGVNPQSRLHAALISHTDGRIYATYYSFNSGLKSDGWWLLVLNPTGTAVLADIFLSAPGYFPTYNYAQLTQDGSGRIYVVQFSEGADAAQLRFFPLTEATGTFTIPLMSSVPDLGPATFGALRPYTVYIPRLTGGNRKPGNWQHFLFAVAEDTYNPGAGERFPSDPGYGRNLATLHLLRVQYPD